MKRLVLYSRAECHLCEQLLEALGPLLERGGATVRVVDVDGDAGLARRYGERIPVLTTDSGEELSEFPLDAERVERYLENSGA